MGAQPHAVLLPMNVEPNCREKLIWTDMKFSRPYGTRFRDGRSHAGAQSTCVRTRKTNNNRIVSGNFQYGTGLILPRNLGSHADSQRPDDLVNLCTGFKRPTRPLGGSVRLKVDVGRLGSRPHRFHAPVYMFP